MKNLRRAMDSLYAWGRNITGATAKDSRRGLNQANLKDTWTAPATLGWALLNLALAVAAKGGHLLGVDVVMWCL